MTKEEVLQLTCKKHVKIYKLKKLGLSNKEIATELSTNSGHVYNALKKYETDPKLIELSDKII